MRLLRPDRSVAVFLLTLWAPGSVVLVAAMMMSHLLALPTPLSRAVETALVRQGEPRGTWLAFHVLYADCPCSQRVALSLEARGARADFDERVLLVGHDPALLAALSAKRFHVDSITPDELKERFGIEAAPAFFAVAADGSVPYVGGYSGYQEGPAEDTRILSLVRHGLRPEPLPLFGCAVSRELQVKADPLGLKYSLEATR